MIVKVKENVAFKEYRGSTVQILQLSNTIAVCEKGDTAMIFSTDELENTNGTHLSGGIEIGDKIRIIRPKTDEGLFMLPGWWNSMDKFDNTTATVTGMGKGLHGIFFMASNKFSFHNTCVELVKGKDDNEGKGQR
jgi:hypothetical protein